MQAAQSKSYWCLVGSLRLGLEIELAAEADFPGVIDRQVHEGGQVLELALHVGVPEALVSFAAAPEHVALPAQFLGHFQGLFDLGGGEGEGVGVATGGRAVHVARIAEQVGGAPEQLDAAAVLLLLEHLDHRVEVLVGLGQRGALGGDVAVVEAIERCAELVDELEGHGHAVDRIFDRVGRPFPGPPHRARSERVAARAAKRVPIGHAEAEMILHRLAFDQFAGVVVAERQRVLRVGAFVGDVADLWECRHGERWSVVRNVCFVTVERSCSRRPETMKIANSSRLR